MPKIVEYEAKDAALHPSDLGDSAYTQAARRTGAFYEQMATGTREIGVLQKDLDDDVGRSLTGFLRLKGLEDQANDINVKVTGKGGARTLIGTGENGPQNYARLNELANGPHYLSRVARQAVAATSPITDTVENGVNVLRGGADQDKSDVENGVTVFRGGSPLGVQDPLKNLKQPDAGYQLSGYGVSNNPYIQPADNGGFPLPIQSGDQLPAAGSLGTKMEPTGVDKYTGQDTYSGKDPYNGPGVSPRFQSNWYNPMSWGTNPTYSLNGSIQGGDDTTYGNSPNTPQQSAIPIEQDSAPSMWSDIGDNQ